MEPMRVSKIERGDLVRARDVAEELNDQNGIPEAEVAEASWLTVLGVWEDGEVELLVLFDPADGETASVKLEPSRSVSVRRFK